MKRLAPALDVAVVIAAIVYVLLRRNLWPLIVVHGVWNTVGIWSVYAS
jgi:uncharacterized protein